MKNVNQLKDESLVELIRSEDQELYREIVRRYQKKLLRYAAYLTRDESKAADVVQTTFIKAFVNLKGFNNKKNFSSWIYRIAHNEAINLVKKEKKKMSLNNLSWNKDLSSSDPGMTDLLAKKDEQIMIRKNLKKLPLKYREPLTLFFIENKSYGEISDILRIPTGTVGTRISRGKKQIKTLITGLKKNEKQSKK